MQTWTVDNSLSFEGSNLSQKMAQSFSTFFEGWLTKQEKFLEKLLILSSSSSSSDGIDKEEECNDLVAQVLAHYQKYYEEKTKVMNENVFIILSQPWLSSFERTLLWIGGFKPSMVFTLIKKSSGETLSNDQVERIELIRAETRREEKEVEKAMASIQESIAAPPIFDLMRRQRLVDGEINEKDEAMNKFKAKMIMVMESADNLRGSTVRKLAEILSPFQTAKFLAAAAQFTLNVRRWGLEKDDGQGSATIAWEFELSSVGS